MMAASVWGSIPACAGEPWPARGKLAGKEVYPRVCGGTSGRVSVPYAAVGLSPRVRGNRLKVVAGDVQVRSIPACAGEP